MKIILTLLFAVDLTLGSRTSVFGAGNDLQVSAFLKSVLIVAGYLLLLTRNNRPTINSKDVLTLDGIVYWWAAISTVAMLVGLMQPEVSVRYVAGDYFKFISLAAIMPLFYRGLESRAEVFPIMDRVVHLFATSAFVFLCLFGLGIVEIYTITPPGQYVPLITPLLLSRAGKTSGSHPARWCAIIALIEACGLVYCTQSLNLLLTTLASAAAFLIFSKRLRAWHGMAMTASALLFAVVLSAYPGISLSIADNLERYILKPRAAESHILQKFRLVVLNTDMSPSTVVDSLGGGRTGELLGLIEYFSENPGRLFVGAGMGVMPKRVATEMAPDPLTAHAFESTYSEVLYRTGLPGLCILLLLQLIFLRRAVVYGNTQGSRDGAAVALAFGCILFPGYFMGVWIAQPYLMWFILLAAVSPYPGQLWWRYSRQSQRGHGVDFSRSQHNAV